MKITMRTFAIVLIGLACLGSARLLFPSGDAQAERDRLRSKVNVFMRAKLFESQQVLEGVTTENFDLIRQGAEKMIVMSKAAEWRAQGGDVYAVDTKQFVAAAKDLIREANRRNVDGATVSYLQLTMSCVVCHKHIREEKTSGILVPQRKIRP